VKILLDTLQAGNLSGTGTYAISLAESLPGVLPDAEIGLVVPNDGAVRFMNERLEARYPSSTARFPLGTVARSLQMRAAIRDFQPDVVHYPASFLRLAGRGGLDRVKLVVTVHDLSFLRHPEWFTRSRAAYYRAAIRPTVTKADLILADSEATAHDLQDLLGVATERIVVTPLGVNTRFAPASTEDVARARKTYQLPERFFLYLGTIEPRKNLARLIEAFNAIANTTDLDLVIAGREGWRADSTIIAHRLSPFRSRIHFPGFVADDDLPALLSAAEVFVWPSLWEGFGLPPLEAMACGVPVITSSTSSLPEVVGDAAMMVDPEDVPALADAMATLAGDEMRRADLRNAGLERAGQFTWRRTAELTARAYRRVLDV
jgi:glycosyltransferase involved in cell wall biosynthesis